VPSRRHCQRAAGRSAGAATVAAPPVATPLFGAGERGRVQGRCRPREPADGGWGRVGRRTAATMRAVRHQGGGGAAVGNVRCSAVRYLCALRMRTSPVETAGQVDVALVRDQAGCSPLAWMTHWLLGGVATASLVSALQVPPGGQSVADKEKS